MDDQLVLGDLFGEAADLRLDPRIAMAISEGRVSTAWNRYDKDGRREGCKPNDFDADYFRAYPASHRTPSPR